MRLKILTYLLLVAFCCWSWSVESPDPPGPKDDSYRVKLSYIEKFSRFIQWPNEHELKSQDSFIIGVVSPDPFKQKAESFQQFKKIKGKQIEFRFFEKTEMIEGIHLLYIPYNHDLLFQDIQERLPEQVLTISERKGYAKKGAHINFYSEGQFVRFEMNKKALDTNGFKVNSNLLKLAKIVE